MIATDHTLARAVHDTPFGQLTLLASDTGLRHVLWPGREAGVVARIEDDPGHLVIRSACRQLDEYASGVRTGFDLPLDLRGTEFQTAVWNALRDVPHAATTTYGEIARRIGRPSAVRAVGAAVGRNPVCIVVPCHRVVGSDGSLTGFAGGLDTKRRLLAHEAGLIGENSERTPHPA